MKPNVKKVRRLGQENSVIAGFAGSTADAFALFERLESKLDQYKNHSIDHRCSEQSGHSHRPGQNWAPAGHS